jgi:hypothetical protein
LQKCKEIKEKREYQKEMEAIDQSNIVEGKLRLKTKPERAVPSSQPSSFDYLTKLGDVE